MFLHRQYTMMFLHRQYTMMFLHRQYTPQLPRHSTTFQASYSSLWQLYQLIYTLVFLYYVSLKCLYTTNIINTTEYEDNYWIGVATPLTTSTTAWKCFLYVYLGCLVSIVTSDQRWYILGPWLIRSVMFACTDTMSGLDVVTSTGRISFAFLVAASRELSMYIIYIITRTSH